MLNSFFAGFILCAFLEELRDEDYKQAWFSLFLLIMNLLFVWSLQNA